jgi:hypothetical protein
MTRSATGMPGGASSTGSRCLRPTVKAILASSSDRSEQAAALETTAARIGPLAPFTKVRPDRIRIERLVLARPWEYLVQELP